MSDPDIATDPWSASDEIDETGDRIAPAPARFTPTDAGRHLRRAMRWSSELVDEPDLIDWPDAFDGASAVARCATYIGLLQRMCDQAYAEVERRELADAGRKPN